MSESKGKKTKKKSINAVMGMQSKRAKTNTPEPTQITTPDEPKELPKGSEGGLRKSPRITVTISRSTYDELHTEVERQKDAGERGSMSEFVDKAIRKALKLKS